MIYKSTHKYARISPTKVRRIAVVMTGGKYDEVMMYLKYLPHAGARIVEKVTKSAASNALSKHKQLDESSLFVKSIIANEGPRMKRVWARARGRADVLLKRFTHVTVEITDDKNEISKKVRERNEKKKTGVK